MQAQLKRCLPARCGPHQPLQRGALQLNYVLSIRSTRLHGCLLQQVGVHDATESTCRRHMPLRAMQTIARALHWAGREDASADANAEEGAQTGFLVHVVPLSTIMRWCAHCEMRLVPLISSCICKPIVLRHVPVSQKRLQWQVRKPEASCIATCQISCRQHGAATGTRVVPLQSPSPLQPLPANSATPATQPAPVLHRAPTSLVLGCDIDHTLINQTLTVLPREFGQPYPGNCRLGAAARTRRQTRSARATSC